MSDTELQTLEEMVHSELGQRHNLIPASNEITQILDKYSVSFEAVVEFRKTSHNKQKPSRAKKPRLDKRKAVAARYKSPNDNSKWSGRGKPPAWVKKICETDNISLEQFKKSDVYKC